MDTKDKFEGKIIIFTAPSGSGKTTIVRHLLKKYDFLGFSVSATSRKKREKEVDGKDYYFLSEEKFRKKVEEGAFVEWEEVYPGKFYGTLKLEIERIWSKGKHVVFDIEVKGATNMVSVQKSRYFWFLCSQNSRVRKYRASLVHCWNYAYAGIKDGEKR